MIKLKKPRDFITLLFFVLYLTFSGNAAVKELKRDTVKINKIKINILYKQAKPGDSLSTYLVDIINPSTEFESRIAQWKPKSADGLFHYELSSKADYGYFKICVMDKINSTLQYGYVRTLTEPLFWEKGDSITIELSNAGKQSGTNSIMYFSGPGYEKYTVKQAVLNEIEKKYSEKYPTDQSMINAVEIPIFDRQFKFQSFEQMGRNIGVETLEKYKSELSDVSYNILKADFLFGNSSSYPNRIRDYMASSGAKFSNEEMKLFLKGYKSSYSNVNFREIDSSYVAESIGGLGYLRNKFIADSYVYNSKLDPLFIYNAIKASLKGKLRDRTLIYTFNQTSKRTPNTDSILRDARIVMRDTQCLTELSRLDKIYNNKNFLKYSLLGKDGKPVNLNKFKGKVILIDFYFGGCGACIEYFGSVLSKVEHKYRNSSDVVFIAVSADKTRSKWFQSLTSGKMTSDLAVNLRTNNNGFYDPILTENEIHLYPSVVLIDKNGVVKNFNSANLYQIESLQSAIESIR